MNTELETFCKDVEKRAEKIYGAAGNGNSERAALLALELVQFAMTTRHQAKMQKEITAGDWNLNALVVVVDADKPSNSETPFEDE